MYWCTCSKRFTISRASLSLDLFWVVWVCVHNKTLTFYVIVYRPTTQLIMESNLIVASTVSQHAADAGKALAIAGVRPR